MPQFYRGDHPELAATLIQGLSTPPNQLVFDEDKLWQFSEGVWKPVSNASLSQLICRYAGCVAGGRALKLKHGDILGIIATAKDLVDRPGFFAAAPVGLAFSNNIFVTVGFAGLEFSPLTADHRARDIMPFPYSPGEDTSVVEGWIASYFPEDPDGAEKATFIQEIFGASLCRMATRFQRCALLLGDGANGKDTVIDILRGAFPENTVSHSPPQRWGQEYVRAALAGKWLNIVGELPNRELETSEAFKAIVAGSTVDAREPYGKVFRLTPQAGHIFALNAMMGTGDFSHGFFRRFGIVRFNRTFSDLEAKRDLVSEMRQHRGAITTWLLQGAANLLARGHYILPSSHTEELHDYRLANDQVAAFLEEQCEIVGDARQGLRVKTLYGHYTTWAQDTGHRPCNLQRFGARARAWLKERKAAEPLKNNGWWYPIGIAGRPRKSSVPPKSPEKSN